MKRKTWLAIFTVCLLLVMSFAVGCQSPSDNNDTGPDDSASVEFPTGPVKIVVARGAGGSTDVIARAIQPYFQKYLGQPVVVENMKGGGGKIGNAFVYDAEPDGYTLLLGVFASDLLTDALEETGYDFSQFVPIYNVGGGDYNALVVAADSPITSYEDLVEEAKTRTLTVAMTAGLSNSQLAYAMLVEETGIEFQVVPYDSGGEAITAAIGGHVDLTLASVVRARDLQEEGRARVIVGFGEERDELLPDVPMFCEYYPGSFANSAQPVLAPPGLPDEIQQVLEDALKQAVNDPEFVASASEMIGVYPLDSDGVSQMMTEMAKFSDKYRETLLTFVGQ